MVDVKGRSEPQITANDLALYMVSTDTGKLGIIRRNKYPSKHVASPYQESKRTIVRYLTSDERDKTTIAEAIEKFQAAIRGSLTTPSKREDARRSIAALEAFLAAANVLDFGRFNFKDAPKLDPLMVQGVKVSVTLDLLTSTTIKGVEYQGGVLLRMTLPEDTDAGKAKRENMGGFSATLALMQVEDKRPIPHAEPLPKICWSVDVQAKQKYEAKAGSSQRRTNIINACTMIKSIWPSV